MEPGKSLLVRFETSQGSKEGNKDDVEDSLTKDISLDYSEDDEEMLPDSPVSLEQNRQKETNFERESFAPIDDVDVFAVDDSHVDTSGGEIRRKTNVEMVFDAEKFGGPANVKRYMNPRLKENDEFVSFLNSDEQKTRRAERAKRFGLEPSSDASVGAGMIDEPTAAVLEKLYGFFKIDPDNVRHKSKCRLNTLYLRGVNNLPTDKIFDYFGPYNPTYLEWIDDGACNLVWEDQAAAARALLGMSKPLRRIRKSKENDLDTEDFVSPMRRGDSIEQEQRTVPADVTMASKDEDVERILDDEEPLDVDVSQYTVPPGSWRVGKKNNQVPGIVLMRFATVDDVKIRGAQRRSNYYREHGNPNFGGQTGFISRSYVDRESRKRRRGSQDEEESLATSKSLFQNDLRKSINDRARWNLLREDARRSQELEPGELVEEEDVETGEVKLTYFSSDEEQIVDSDDESSKKRPRMRMRADEEEDRKEDKRRRLRNFKSSSHRSGGIDGDWRTQRDLRGILDDARMRITVPNDRTSTNDLRHRLGTRKSPDRRDYEDRRGRETRW